MGPVRFWDDGVPATERRQGERRRRTRRKVFSSKGLEEPIGLAHHLELPDQRRGPEAAPECIMDIARPSIARKKKIRRIVLSVTGLIAVALVTVALARLKPAAPTV